MILKSSAIKQRLKEEKIALTDGEMEEVLSDENFLKDIGYMFEDTGALAGGGIDALDFVLYKDVEELGADESDSGCRDDDDDDESFGEFILQAHYDGNECGRSAILELSSGKILLAY